MSADTGRSLGGVAAWVIDVDGCLVRTSRAGGSGGDPIPGAADLLTHLTEAGTPFVVCTNASQRHPRDYARHLRSIGLPVPDESFVSAGSAAAEHVVATHPGARVLVVGDDGVSGPLADLGVTLVAPTTPDADVVVVGAADRLEATHLTGAALSVEAGAPLYTTVATPWFHGGRGKSVASSSAFAHAIGWAAGSSPTVLGKPSPGLASTLVRRLGVDGTSIAVVGDATAEIDLARHMGGLAVTLLTGALTTEAIGRLEPSRRPDLILDDISHVLTALTHADEGVRHEH